MNISFKNRMRKTLKNKFCLSLMHFLTILLLSNVIQLYNVSLHAQANTTVTLNLKNVTVEKCLSVIETKTKYRFIYNKQLVDVNRIVSVNVKNEDVIKVLTNIFDGTVEKFTIEGNQIVLSKVEKKASSQRNRKVAGIITDENGATIIGANIKVEGLSLGTMSDLNGKFMLEAPIDGKLTVSYIGYISKTIAISGKSNLNITLSEDTKALNEVVVVGYGVIKKSDYTGSVSSFKNEKSEEKAYSSIEQMLQGQAAGVQITQNTGALGGGMTFAIRGANSVSGNNQPLVVIDGYPVESGTQSINIGNGDGSISGDQPGLNVLSMLNPNDVESIEILKDASATAIYGSRGANGVVMVTTKRGKDGREKIDYSFRTDMSYLPKLIDVLNTRDFMAYSNEAYNDRNDGTIKYSQADIDKYMATNTNWQDLIFETGISQNHQLNISGGDKKLRYALNAGYLNQKGIVKNSNYDRGTIRLNLDREVDSRLKFSVNVSGHMSDNRSVNQSAKVSDLGATVVGSALRSLPLVNAFDPENADIYYQSGFTNPLVLVTKAADRTKGTQIMLSGAADYKLLDGLTFRVRLGLNTANSNRQSYTPRGTPLGDLRKGMAYNGTSKNSDYLNEYTLSFNKTIYNKHSINAVGGFTWQSWISEMVGISASQFPNDNFGYYNLNSALAVSTPASSTTEWSLASFLGRINYSYDKRYMITLTGRYDGSTRLAKGKKWDIFPSGALAWNVHNEKFMKSLKHVTELKLRSSYGISGNQSIGVGSTQSRYGYATTVQNEALILGYYLNGLANPNLSWENTSQLNVGCDLGMWNNRLRFSVDYYNKRTTGMLVNLPIPITTGYSSYPNNAGEVENKGLEFALGGNILTGDVKWNMKGNISFNRNKILSFDGNMESFLGAGFGLVNGQSLHIAKVGYPIGSFYGFKTIGIYQTQEEINNYAKDPANPIPGSFKFADISGPNGMPDGLISAYDRTIIGNPYPDYIFGINNDVSWKGFSLNIFIQGSIGQDIANINRYNLDGLSLVTVNNVRTEAYNNRWTGPGTSNTYPGLRTAALPFAGRFSNFILEDGSYIRLKNITFSYTFDTKKIKVVKSLKVFGTATNLITITNYKGYDPEISSRGQNAMEPGIDGGSIPQYVTVSAGFNVGF